MFEPSAKVQELQARLQAFMDAHIYPNEPRHLQEAETLGPWKVHPVVEALKAKARAKGYMSQEKIVNGKTHLVVTGF